MTDQYEIPDCDYNFKKGWTCVRVKDHHGACALVQDIKPLIPGPFMAWVCKRIGHAPWYTHCARCGKYLHE